MRRAVFHGAGRVTIEEAPDPQPGFGELLVRVHACAMCGSDRGLWENGAATTPGHETAGVVEAVGPGASVPVGAFGAVFLVAYCGECRMCARGSRGACLHKEAMLGFNRDGGFAELVTVPERCFMSLDPTLELDDAVMLLDVVGTPMHALRRLDLGAESALVMGAGPVGLGAVLALRAVGAKQVLAVDVSQYRLDFAAQLGATPILGGDGAPAAVRAELPEGPVFVIEASGSPAGQRQALDLLAPGGTMVTLGHSRAPLEVWTSRDLIAEERTILGSEYFDNREFADNQRLILEGRLAPSQIVTHRLPLESIEEGYELFWSGRSGKVLLYPNGGAQ